MAGAVTADARLYAHEPAGGCGQGAGPDFQGAGEGQEESGGYGRKLSNEKFTARAPEAVVNAEREKAGEVPRPSGAAGREQGQVGKAAINFKWREKRPVYVLPCRFGKRLRCLKKRRDITGRHISQKPWMNSCDLESSRNSPKVFCHSGVSSQAWAQRRQIQSGLTHQLCGTRVGCGLLDAPVEGADWLLWARTNSQAFPTASLAPRPDSPAFLQ